MLAIITIGRFVFIVLEVVHDLSCCYLESKRNPHIDGLKYINYYLPAHLKSSLIGSEITIPITRHRLNLGTWQGIYFCEFRNFGGSRRIVLTVFS